MNIQTLSIRMVAAALAIGLAGCASEPPTRYTSRPSSYTPKPQPSGYVSVRYVQPTATQASPAPASADKQLPHLRRSLAYLQTAKAKLEAATAGKGGNRRDAIRHTDDAIAHVEAGIARANSR